jgi:hypothetical protein
VQYLRKYNIYQFTWLAERAAQFGTIKIFSYEKTERTNQWGSEVISTNKDYCVSDIPVVSSLCAFKPKEFFIVTMSFVKVAQYVTIYFSAKKNKDDRPLNFIALLDLSLDMGKITVITLSHYLKENKTVAFLSCVIMYGAVLKEVLKIHELYVKSQPLAFKKEPINVVIEI